ncbi:hypothetical protein [Petrocella sp. FN5]|uniref:hypothetical protein n=1 Tax=Petrocella sp. FN5 TaxID=3032002 RepID=UPI0023DC74FA|nr:hypothetical protein [Petrocella sp. FN5]MDF1617269.1 hypothetical protein [Petrocella sp. FN5]
MQRYDLDVSRLIEIFTKEKLENIVKTHRNILKKINNKKYAFSNVSDNNLEIESKSLYYFITYVYMLEESFSINSFKVLELVSEISMLIIHPFQHFLLANYENKDEMNTPAKNLQLQIGLCEGVEKLQRILSKESMEKFWTYFNKYYNEVLEGANLFKLNHVGKIKNYTEEDIFSISVGLNAHSKIVLPILAGINNEFDKISLLEKSLDHYYVAHKLFLDLKIWKKDLEREFYTPILTEVIMAHKNAIHDKEKIMDLLYGNNYDEKYLIKANREVEKALFLCGSNAPCQKSLRSIQSRINLLLYDFRTLKGEPKRIYPYIESNKEYSGEDIKKQIADSVKWILNQSKSGYPELTHWGVFLHPYGFTGEEQALPGDVYYRSYLLNLMFSMKNNSAITNAYFEKELNYLENRKHRYFKEGWGHFPDLPEIPPDIGTLGEIILNAVAARDVTLLKYTKELVDKIISQNPNKDGTINYWLTEKDQKGFFNSISSVKCIYIRTLLKKMYKNPVISANAQFIYALIILDYNKYSEVIENVYSSILSKQNPDGSWKDYYFTGVHFAIWQILRCTKQLNRFNSQIRLSLKYLLESQHDNGAWGQVFGDPKESSYAILSLIEILELSRNKIVMNETEKKAIVSSIHKGIIYLMSSATGSYWHGVDFGEIQIKKISTEPADFIEYRSATLTTAVSAYALNRFYSYMEHSIEGETIKSLLAN